MRIVVLAIVLLVLGCSLSSVSIHAAEVGPYQAASSPPRSPADSLACLEVRDGFQVELMAAEPLVVDPIAIAWGADGKLWVVEMGDYPTASTGGRIRFLEDTDQDGKPDRSTVFLDGLSFPTGVLPWRDGVLVTCAPEIFFAADDDGDGRADRRETLFTGFAPGNPQHRVNGLRWGLDNWVHCANGDSGGIVTSLETGEQVDIHGHDFRIRPDQGSLQRESGMSQFGRCCDDWGNWFGGNNSWPFWHTVLEEHYLRRNPDFQPPEACVHVIDPPANAPVFPAGKLLPRLNDFALGPCLTSACGVEVYRDELLGPKFRASFFVCEPAHNLVHHETLQRQGVSFRSRRPVEEANSEFLASRDVWFRPTQVRTGPDGGLWVVDMYRLVIEHPDWISPELQADLDFQAGSSRGRLYRVLPRDVQPRREQPLSKLDIPQLVAALETPNGPRRDLIQQALVERQDRAAIEPLERLAVQGGSAQVRLSALGTLAGLDAIQRPLLLATLADVHPAIRRHAIRLAEDRLDDDGQLLAAVRARWRDSDPQVRQQLAFSLGACRDPAAGKSLAQLIASDVDDAHIRAAAMSSANHHLTPVLGELLDARSDPQSRTPAMAELITELLILAIETDRTRSLAKGLRQLVPADCAHADWQLAVLADFFERLLYRGYRFEDLADSGDSELRDAVAQLAGLFDVAQERAANERVPEITRVQAIRLLGRRADRQQHDLRFLEELLRPDSPLTVQSAAVEALSRMDHADVPDRLLRGWRRYDAVVWQAVLDALLSRDVWTRALLARLQSREIPAAVIDPTHRHRLILHHLADIRRQSSQLLDKHRTTDRAQVVRSYQSQTAPQGDPQRGAQLFQQHCVACHPKQGQGVAVGPNLQALSDRSTAALLTAILDPNRSVAPRGLEYVAVTNNGRIFTGVLLNEVNRNVTLADAQGKRHVLNRSELETFECQGRSLMPEGFERVLATPQDMADLLSVLRGE